jgi:hypothetical protein
VKVLIDNDIIFKGTCYGLLPELIGTVCVEGDAIGVLGAARFVISKRIQRATVNKGADAALSNLEAFLSRTLIIEPTEAEQNLAAELELAALKSGVALDAGESQLCAVAAKRLVDWLLTGDKRAIRAIELLLDFQPTLAAIVGKVKCLEQLVLTAVRSNSTWASLRAKICAEVAVDKALAICLCCASQTTSEDCVSGLESYIEDLRSEAGRVLSA